MAVIIGSAVRTNARLTGQIILIFGKVSKMAAWLIVFSIMMVLLCLRRGGRFPECVIDVSFFW
jgi:hypothetical protein